IGDIDIAMSSYFANSYLPDMRPAAGVGNGDHYGPPHQQQQPNGDHCDQRQYLPYGGSPGHQGYPRFPPYDRLEIRAISSAPDSPSPPSGYYGNHCGAPPAPPPPTPVQQQQPPQAMTHPNAYVPAPVEAPNCRGSPSEAPVPPAMAHPPGVHSPPLQQQQQQLYSPGHGGMPPNGQQPPTHNSGAMPSPLYPWMRSQF
ncbi:Antennapedia, putative, partial [Ixodes scapularis]